MTYSPGGRVIKHPRACPPVWKTSDGKYLFWYHNNGIPRFNNRNPAWVTGGIELGGKIHWSQPEILLYDDDPAIGMSYPGLIEQGGRFWVTETNKSVARVHKIDTTLLEGLWTQGRVKEVTRSGLVLALDAAAIGAGGAMMPRLATRPGGRGFSIDMVLRLDDLSPGRTILDSRDPSGRGIALITSQSGALRISLGDGTTERAGDSDASVLTAGKDHRVTVTLDGGPRILMFIVDGVLCDGGSERTQGFTRVNSDLGDVNGEGESRLQVSPAIRTLRIYDRPLRTSEAVANHQASE
jgi:hypothetical protein